MKLFESDSERAQLTTMLAGALLAADVCACGLAPSDGNTASARELRVGEAFELAKQFVAFAERAGDK